MELARKPSLSGFSKPLGRPAGLDGELRLLDMRSGMSADLLREWAALSSHCSEPNPFFEEWFAVPSHEQFAQGDNFKLAAYWQAGRLAGVFPLMRCSNYYGHPLPHMRTWLHDHAFCGAPLVANGCERGFWQALLAQLDQGPGPALFLHLPALPEHGSLNQALELELSEVRRTSAIVERGERAMLSSSLDAESYLKQAMSTKKRKELRRQRKRLEELGELTFERLEDTQCIELWIEQFLALEAAGWKGKAGSALKANAASYAFFADTMRGAAQARKLERLTLRLDGKPIAMLANFLTPSGAYSFKTAFDENYARFSPGLLLQIENLAMLERKDIAWTDSCAVEGHSMIERIWREKRAFVSRNIAIGGPLRRLTARALMAYETRKRS